MRNFLFLLCLLFSVSAQADIDTEKVLGRLDEVIDNRDYFADLKLARIAEIHQHFSDADMREDLHAAFDYYHDLSREYQTFKFDSAFHYSSKLLETAHRLGDKNKIVIARNGFANILISAGIFSEAMDTLQAMDLSGAGHMAIADYYSVLSRGYFDMESFSQSQFYSVLYHEKGMVYMDSALNHYPEPSWQYLSMKAQKDIKQDRCEEGIDQLNHIISTFDLNNDQLAIQLMWLSFAHGILGNEEEQLRYMVEASVADFTDAKKEAVALFFVAGFLFDHGEVIRSSRYINVALEETHFYGSNFRLWQISQYLPVIKTEHIVTIEKQKKKLRNYLVFVSILSLIVVLSLFVIFRQNRKLSRVRRMLEASNKKLEAINDELLLSNKIKEEYVGYYFSVSSQMIEKLEKFKNSIQRKYSRKQYDDLERELDSINIHREKLFLYNKFDQVFLQIFPDFVEKMNALMKEGEEFKLKEGQLLNTELRIFALTRLGIHDNEKIAEILDYSVNTIYTYKTKVRNMARLSKAEFEKEVMGIKRFG